MPPLKLLALDDEDLRIVSAHVQDAVLRVADIDYRPAEKRIVLAMNRFVWEAPRRLFRKHDERRRSVLHFDRVMATKTSGIDRNKPDEVLSLLAIEFTAGEAPAGFVDILFSGDATIRLEVECIEARLADLGGAWEATSRPAHRV
ncbi:DUF2948 family protein [Aquibium oceanicum]|uniref:DUF2948 domain-containing protein n=1 Tax=Aquibium oceanicum TaxID=1670800 RepID=A0A1L3SVB3_9HYPH|nr:DUF2948 family protein [Aquibium oceanicum]APH73359.1 hypothetical protein BSQ44_19745 [Aquibium oceanicum]